jgi:hypothetical protein
MSSAVFETMRLLETSGLHFYIERTRPDSIRLCVTMVGERLEIEISRMTIWKSAAFAATRPSRVARKRYDVF